MPTYVYKFVDTGETIEIQQSFTDDTLTEAVHPDTGEMMSVKKVFQPVGVTFKGDGFYKTDSRASTTSKTAKQTGSSTESTSSSASTSSSDASAAPSDASKSTSTTPNSGTSSTSKRSTTGSDT